MMKKLFGVAMLLLTATLLLPAVMNVARAMEHDCPDQYVYTKQPPSNLFVCNPYISRTLSMSCSVIGDDVTDIQWWYAPSYEEGERTRLKNSSNYTIEPVYVDGVLEMRLTVHNLNDDDVGSYWCQASVIDAHGLQLLSTSEALVLMDEDSFEGIDNGCNFILKSANTRCASILVTKTVSVAPTTFYEPTTTPSLPPTTQPSPTTLPPPTTPTFPQRPPSLFESSSPTTPTFPQRPPSLFESSSGILYAVLGLVGFLAIVCVLLVVIVIVLCRRRCGKADIKDDAAEKEMSFEHFSHESDMPLMYKHALPSRIIHSDTHSRNLSGDYAEIGPALSDSLERGYSLIGVSHSTLPPLPTELNPETDQFPTTGYENPYDLPMFPPGQEPRRQTAAQLNKLSLSSEVQIEGTDSHEYHMLEQMAPLGSTAAPSPVSPQHTYHILESPNSHLSSSPPVSCDPSSTPSGPDVDDDEYDDVIQHEPSPRLSCSSATETGRLPTIHENELEDQRSVEFSDVVSPTHPTDTVSPDVTLNDPEDCTGFSECSKDDGEYDRLVDPPHLYHVLEHSPLPGGPCIHNIAPAMYSSLETIHSSKRKGTPLQTHVHFLTPQSGVTNLTYSSGSSIDATETNVFDDPQYLVSTPGRTRLAAKCDQERRKRQRSQSYTHEHPSMFSCQTAEAQSETSLSKYSGDYERDPVYMCHLYNVSEKRSLTNSSNGSLLPLLRARDGSMYRDDSGFSTYSGSSRLSLQDREKGSSLPDLTKHIYQPLETDTLEPLQPYAKLNKIRIETAV